MVSTKDYALSLIKRFLLDQHLEPTWEMLKMELDLDYLNVEPNEGLLQVVEEWRQLKSAEIKGIDKGIQQLSLKGPFNHCQVFNVHSANILAVKIINTTSMIPSSTTPMIPSTDITTPMILTASTDKTVRLTSLNGSLLAIMDHHQSAVLCLDKHPTKDWIATGAMDGSLSVVDLSTLQPIQTFKDHSKYVVCCLFYDELLISASSDKTLLIYHQQGEEYSLLDCIEFKGPIQSMCLMNDQLVVAIRDDAYLHFIKLEAPFEQVQKSMNEDHFNVLDVKCAKDKLLLYTDCESGKICMMQVENEMKVVGNFYGTDNDCYSMPKCVWDPNGYVWATSDDQQIYGFSLATGKLLKKLSGHTGKIRDLYYDQEMDILVSCSYDATVRVWSRD